MPNPIPPRDSWIERFLLPSPATFSRPFGKALPWLSMFLLLLLVICAIPMVRDWLVDWYIPPPERPLWRSSKIEIVSWIECLRITTEVVIAVTISGQVFSSALKSRLQSWVDEYQDTRQKIIEGHVEKVSEKIRDTAATIKTELDKPVKFLHWPKHLWRLFNLAKQLHDLLFRDTPRLQVRIVMLSFYTCFPGGLYGLTTYLLFFALVALKIAKLYMESPVFLVAVAVIHH